jgi:hypothetical protein
MSDLVRENFVYRAQNHENEALSIKLLAVERATHLTKYDITDCPIPEYLKIGAEVQA